MHRAGRYEHPERAASSIEFVGVAVAVALLTGGVAGGLHAKAPTMVGVVGRAMQELVEHGRFTRRTRTAHEIRTGVDHGIRVRVSRDELRLPATTGAQLAAMRWSDARDASAFGIRASIGASACAVCASWKWDHDAHAGAVSESSGVLHGSAEGVARLALGAIDVTASVERDLGTAGVVRVRGRASALAGVELSAEGEAHAGRTGLDAEVEGGAMAGASAKAEAHAGVSLFGVAIQQSGRAEGWAGAGVKGAAGLHASKGRLQWRLGWGAALGFGGAAEWSGSIDVNEALGRHRRLARDALQAALP